MRIIPKGMIQMTDAYRKAKTPDQTRNALLEAASRQALSQGIAAITLPGVAEAAGVTKGALFHHFGSKQGLIEALCEALIAQIDSRLDTVLARDAGGFGCFTRAYVICTFHPGDSISPQEKVHDPAPRNTLSPWSSLSLSALTDPGLARIWSNWFQGRLARHAATDADPGLELVRLATDGYWLGCLQGHPPQDAGTLFQRLIAATHAAPAPSYSSQA